MKKGHLDLLFQLVRCYSDSIPIPVIEVQAESQNVWKELLLDFVK
jgi:hypothetical protein